AAGTALDAVVDGRVAEATGARVVDREAVEDLRPQERGVHRLAGLDVRGAGNVAVELVQDAGGDAARGERQHRAKEELARSAARRARRVARAADRRVVGAAPVVDLTRTRVRVRDRAGDVARAARTARSAATRQPDGHFAVRDDRGAVRDARP